MRNSNGIEDVLRNIEAGDGIAGEMLQKMDGINIKSTLWGVHIRENNDLFTEGLESLAYDLELRDITRRGISAMAVLSCDTTTLADDIYTNALEHFKEPLGRFLNEKFLHLAQNKSDVLQANADDDKVEFLLSLEPETFQALKEHFISISRDIPEQEVNHLVLARRKPAPENNGFTYFKKAAEKLHWPEEDIYGYISGNEVNGVDKALIVNTVRRNSEVFDYIRQGVNCGISVSPMEVEEFQSGYLSSSRSLARMISVKVYYHLERNEYNEAVTACVMNLRFADMAMNDSSSLFHSLVGIATISTAFDDAKDIITSEEITTAQLDRLVFSLGNMSPPHQAMANSFRGEYQKLACRIEWVAEGQVPEDEIIYLFMPYINLLGRLNNLTGYFLQPNRTKNIFPKEIQKIIGDLPLCYAEVKERENADDLYVCLFDFLTTPNPVGRYIAEGNIHSSRAALRRKAFIESHINTIYLIAVLHKYKRAEGAPPRELAELVPHYIDSIPRDPFNCEPLNYKPAFDVVYSVGENLEDNGGRAVFYYENRGRVDDLVYRAGVNPENFRANLQRFIYSNQPQDFRAAAIEKAEDRNMLRSIVRNDESFSSTLRRAARRRLRELER